MNSNKQLVGVRFTPRQLAALNRISRKEGVSRSEIIRAAVLRELARWTRLNGA